MMPRKSILYLIAAKAFLIPPILLQLYSYWSLHQPQPQLGYYEVYAPIPLWMEIQPIVKSVTLICVPISFLLAYMGIRCDIVRDSVNETQDLCEECRKKMMERR